MKWLESAYRQMAKWVDQHENSIYIVTLSGWARLLFAIGSAGVFALIGGWIFAPDNPYPTAVKFFIPPAAGIVFIVLAGSMFVRDVYGLRTLKPALQHVIASVFGFLYPTVEISGGKMRVGEGEENALEKIGGPGFAQIQPGNAVIFRQLYKPTRASVTSSYFMLPFERAGFITSLDEQHCHVPKVQTTSRDGIKVIIQNIHFRFRIAARRDAAGNPVPRTPEEPYPFSSNAMLRMANNLLVDENGQVPWQKSVEKMVTGEIKDFVASHSIDYLTAPGRDGQDPREAIKRNLFSREVARKLDRLGTELLWVDIGHFAIDQAEVDEQRIDLWKAEWVGSANILRAYGDATRMAYRELGRAESQAELILSIAGALESVDMSKNRVENLRKVLLLRTSQVLDSLRDSPNDPPKKS